jgi:hypothetical protein
MPGNTLGDCACLPRETEDSPEGLTGLSLMETPLPSCSGAPGASEVGGWGEANLSLSSPTVASFSSALLPLCGFS